MVSGATWCWVRVCALWVAIPSSDFVLEDRLASRHHFRIVPHEGDWVLEDMKSTNGTVVNGKRARRVRLSDGDAIAVGETGAHVRSEERLADVERRDAQGAQASTARTPVSY